MKKTILILIALVCFQLTFAQQKQNLHYYKITQKECVKKKGYRLLLKSVVSDSRCPENVTCVWAGEAQIVVSVYQNKKFLMDETLTISSKNNTENAAWFSKYTGKKVESISLLPYPRDGVKTDPKNYYLKMGYVK